MIYLASEASEYSDFGVSLLFMIVLAIALRLLINNARRK